MLVVAIPETFLQVGSGQLTCEGSGPLTDWQAVKCAFCPMSSWSSAPSTCPSSTGDARLGGGGMLQRSSCAGARLVGFGLGGLEAGVSRASFCWAFDRARAAGLASVPHAGEADGPASIAAALDALGADRVGRGVRAVEEPALLEHLVEEQIPLKVCPSSNVHRRVRHVG